MKNIICSACVMTVMLFTLFDVSASAFWNPWNPKPVEHVELDPPPVAPTHIAWEQTTRLDSVGKMEVDLSGGGDWSAMLPPTTFDSSTWAWAPNVYPLKNSGLCRQHELPKGIISEVSGWRTIETSDMSSPHMSSFLERLNTIAIYVANSTCVGEKPELIDKALLDGFYEYTKRGYDKDSAESINSYISELKKVLAYAQENKFRFGKKSDPYGRFIKS